MPTSSTPPAGRGAGASLWSFLWFGIALFCLAAAVYFSGRERQYVNETVRLRQQLEAASGQLAQWREASAILAADPAVSTLGPDQPGGIELRILESRGRGVLLAASHLPQLPAGKVYEVWSGPVSIGVLRPDSAGAAIEVNRNAPEIRGSPIRIVIGPGGSGPTVLKSK